jgi:hypothetical protein
MARAPGVPEPLARAENRLVRPRDLEGYYRANPRAEFQRLVDRGVLVGVATGYYLVVPDEHRGSYWHPAVEAVALGIAVADYGRGAAALMGPSAARQLGAIPRALHVAAVAVPKQRPPLTTAFGRVEFVKRAMDALDTQRTDTEVTRGLVTTPEQTVVDLAARPTLGDVIAGTAAEAIRALAGRCDHELVRQLAERQRKAGAWRRYSWLVGLEPPAPTRRPVSTLGLTAPGLDDPAGYGLTRAT